MHKCGITDWKVPVPHFPALFGHFFPAELRLGAGALHMPCRCSSMKPNAHTQPKVVHSFIQPSTEHHAGHGTEQGEQDAVAPGNSRFSGEQAHFPFSTH